MARSVGGVQNKVLRGVIIIDPIYMHIAVEHARKSCPQAERAAAPNGEQSLPRDASRGRHSDTWQIRRTVRAMSETSSTNQIRVACAIRDVQFVME